MGYATGMLSDLHVAIDCRVIDPHYPGIGRAVLETVRAMARDDRSPRLSLLVGPDAPAPALAELDGADRARLVPVEAWLRSPADQWALPRALRRLDPDVYHAPYYAVPAVIPAPLVLTVHDLIPQLFPGYWPNQALRATIDLWTRYAIRRAGRIIAVSGSTAADLARLMPTTADKTRVVPQGVSPRPRPRPRPRPLPAPADPPYLLYVGSNKPHKNLPRLVAAFARVAPEMAGDLVIAGAWDEHYPQAMDLARRRGLADRVRVERRPTDQRLDELFAGATAFVFPSLYEGFGLPVLEAMAAGLPVATGDRGSLKEVAGDAALLFDPTDEGALAAALRRLLRDEELRARLAAAGPARAALFPWSRTAEGAWQVYAEAARIKQSTRHRRRQGAHRRRQGA
jgi:glycosyltransferase involved in cell wall biosynthesis